MPRIKSLDLELGDHKKYLRRQIASLKRTDPKAAKNYEAFIKELMSLFSDNPPVSWRFVVTSYKYPVFRVFNKRTGRLNDFLRLFPEWGMAITPCISNKRYEKLFPRKRAWYNSGDEVMIDFSTFGQRRRSEYVNVIKSLITTNKDITVNFAAHTCN